MRLDDAASYFEDRAVGHSQVGDVHDAVPFTRIIAVERTKGRGQRKRPDDSPPYVVEGPVLRVGVLCHYHCGFLAQPPGTEGYSHGDSLMAPVMPLRDLKGLDWPNTRLRHIRDTGKEHGVVYLPWPKHDDVDDEWRGHAAALLYRPTLISQVVLDGGACPRIQRLSEEAQHLLMLGMIQVVSPNTFDPQDGQLQRPDNSDSWQTLAVDPS